MTLVIGVVCEARADLRIACEITDRVTCEEVDWIEPDVLDSYRTWRGYTSGEAFLPWTKVSNIAKSLEIKVHGTFPKKDRDARGAYFETRKAVLIMLSVKPTIAALMLIRDADDTDREQGLREARDKSAFGDRIVIGVEHRKREAWVLAGFEPGDDSEQATLERVASELGFDPVRQSQRLIAKQERAKKSAKRILGLLCPSWDRQSVCWKETPLAVLSEHGRENGLAAFISEVKSRLLPLFGKAR